MGQKTPIPGAYDPHLTFDRYFRLGKYARGEYPKLDTLTLFQPNNKVAVAKPSSMRTTGKVVVHIPAKGIDLAKRGHEVRKLFYAGFARSVLKRGYDPEDVLQEVYKGLLVRNRGKCPWDPAKSSFGHYVHMVCRGVFSNYIRRYKRIEMAEVYGTRTPDGEVVDISASNLARVKANQTEVDLKFERNNLVGGLLDLAHSENRDPVVLRECLNLLAQGYRQKEIAVELGCSPHKVSDMVRWARKTLKEVATQ